MSKHNGASGFLVMVVILMIAISTYLVVNYSTGILTAAVSFASPDQIAKFTACAVTIPDELYNLRADVPGLLLPAVYVGLPGLMIIIAILMFIAGYYYGNGREALSTSETTTTTSSPNRSRGGRYARGRRVEKTRTQRSTRSEGN